MTSRGHPASSRIIRHGPALGSGSELTEKKLVVEVESLANENHRLAAAQIILRRDLVSAQEEIQTVKAHIRSTQTESDIQIRVLLEKIVKMEADIKNAANVKKELEQTHKDAQRLVVARQELVDEIEKANNELKVAQLEVKQLPDVLTVLDSMRKEHQRLCSSFEYEKGVNIRKIEQLQVMERELIGMAREVERLQAEVSNAEKSSQTPPVTVTYGVPYQNSDPSHLIQTVQSNGPYYQPYSIHPVHMGVVPAADGTLLGDPAIPAVDGMLPPPPARPPVEETIPPPPASPFDETIPPPPPSDPPPAQS